MIEIVLFCGMIGLFVFLVVLTRKVLDIEQAVESLKEDNQKLAQNVYLNNLTERAIIKVLDTKQNKEVVEEDIKED